MLPIAHIDYRSVRLERWTHAFSIYSDEEFKHFVYSYMCYEPSDKVTLFVPAAVPASHLNFWQ